MEDADPDPGGKQTEIKPVPENTVKITQSTNEQCAAVTYILHLLQYPVHTVDSYDSSITKTFDVVIF